MTPLSLEKAGGKRPWPSIFVVSISAVTNISARHTIPVDSKDMFVVVLIIYRFQESEKGQTYVVNEPS